MLETAGAKGIIEIEGWVWKGRKANIYR